MHKMNLFNVLLMGGCILFVYCLVRFIMGELSDAIQHPMAYLHHLYAEGKKDHTIFDFLGSLLDQIILN
ncbi:hypothetical protein [Paenibacillus polymyxa]|uniref:Uncharacterized protein n=1 Tax=Paenibacillus polymyxa (strain SC2) TaxID=886882 RepID=E3EJW5_PAEPS|nr:hypothetical protein [Paenibacillus polymyxa]ADO59984.1 hypothetical protein PPSC2_28260 [Paenibacillus polymyxa SC2]WPQ59798.1 hypothetical protein SKN87_26275 [Paenibacillus polymyxa]